MEVRKSSSSVPEDLTTKKFEMNGPEFTNTYFNPSAPSAPSAPGAPIQSGYARQPELQPNHGPQTFHMASGPLPNQGLQLRPVSRNNSARSCLCVSFFIGFFLLPTSIFLIGSGYTAHSFRFSAEDAENGLTRAKYGFVCLSIALCLIVGTICVSCSIRKQEQNAINRAFVNPGRSAYPNSGTPVRVIVINSPCNRGDHTNSTQQGDSRTLSDQEMLGPPPKYEP